MRLARVLPRTRFSRGVFEFHGIAQTWHVIKRFRARGIISPCPWRGLEPRISTAAARFKTIPWKSRHTPKTRANNGEPLSIPLSFRLETKRSGFFGGKRIVPRGNVACRTPGHAKRRFLCRERRRRGGFESGIRVGN